MLVPIQRYKSDVFLMTLLTKDNTLAPKLFIMLNFVWQAKP